ncbi:MAG: serine/threonine protein kinase [Moorea sp. SIO1G6]|uniref:serine/threonine-protein kinase n=1 Tax=Moorena sp. SIO1G6 TaxID=2607840 RepID=UPI0013C0D48C|nr:serine/threonine-protein kinase [Moorena sp. SIO1G6]NET65401.1 serine/threonine protein kinase [Moorena sp. SIO1G6]
MSNTLKTGAIIKDRYTILGDLGQGTFGRTYLAEDANRYQERCVLKEFAPQLQNNYELQKAQELFEREAGMLYQLRHNQIPCFRELLRTSIGRKNHLFLVQDYVEGFSYHQLLVQGQKFREADVIKLLQDILPVLDYIHSKQIIHRDISPDNLIKRNSDGKPVLIDFGCVKEMVTTAIVQSTGYVIGTQVGKRGYSPDEQLRYGKADATSDLYALAVTALVLLTGKQPLDFYDSYHATWLWQEITISPSFKSVLAKMLANLPKQRYQSAQEVSEALETVIPQPVSSQQPTKLPNNLPNKQPNNLPTKPANKQPNTLFTQIATLVAAPGQTIKTTFTAVLNRKQQSTNRELKFFGLSMSIALLVVFGTVAVARGGFPTPKLPKISWSLPSIPSLPSKPSVSNTEQQRQKQIYQRCVDLNIDPGTFYQKVDQFFYSTYPQLKGKTLSDKQDDVQFRQAWYQIAEDLLDNLEQEAFLSN